MKQKNNIHADRTPMADVWGLSFPPRTELICKSNTKKKRPKPFAQTPRYPLVYDDFEASERSFPTMTHQTSFPPPIFFVYPDFRTHLVCRSCLPAPQTLPETMILLPTDVVALEGRPSHSYGTLLVVAVSGQGRQRLCHTTRI